MIELAEAVNMGGFAIRPRDPQPGRCDGDSAASICKIVEGDRVHRLHQGAR
jgi:hypothetical protein